MRSGNIANLKVRRWSKIEDHALTYLWTVKGWSMGNIGAKMHRTRHAIAGRIWRLKLVGKRGENISLRSLANKKSAA